MDFVGCGKQCPYKCSGEYSFTVSYALYAGSDLGQYQWLQTTVSVAYRQSTFGRKSKAACIFFPSLRRRDRGVVSYLTKKELWG